jgi:RNA polymerase sigma factor (sigma-70 family)
MNATSATRLPLPPDLTACLERVRSGDQMAARELVAQVHPMVIRLVRLHLPRRDAAEDLTQEVFIKMFARLGQYRGTAPFRAWLSQVTRRTCYDHLRAQRCRPELRYADLTEGEVAGLNATLREENHRVPGEALATRELLHHLLNRLTSDDRRVVVLFNLEQKSIAEIAAITRWNTELVKMRVFRARRKLQRLLASLPHWDRAGRQGAVGPRTCRRPSRVRIRLGNIETAALPETRAAA